MAPLSSNHHQRSYQSSDVSSEDELLWCATWIHRVSQNASYLSYIQSNGHVIGSDDDDFSFSWDDKRAATKVFLAKGFIVNNIGELQAYKQHSDNYICSLIPGSPNSQAQYTPGGLFYKQGQSNLQYVTISPFPLLTYAKCLDSNGGYASCGSSMVTSETLITQTKKKNNYILGDNPMKMSYMVGFGDKYPMRIHHRGSSVPSVHDLPDRISCDAGHKYFNSQSPNPHILVVAIVGGGGR
ncbi:putative cellulase [Helianthus debilis subsp. tardiflorus]